MNTVTIIGGLTRDPELRRTHSGADVCNMRIAFRQGMTDTGYVDVTCWGATAEAVATHKRHGHQVAVTGELRWRSWKDDDEKRHQVLYVNAVRIDFLGRPADAGSAEAASAIDTAVGVAGGPADDQDIPF
jgi:single-strand DNA-binding protein